MNSSDGPAKKPGRRLFINQLSKTLRLQ